jgi:hypothetical protein
MGMSVAMALLFCGGCGKKTPADEQAGSKQLAQAPNESASAEQPAKKAECRTPRSTGPPDTGPWTRQGSP